MFAAYHVIAGIVFIHLAWIYFYVCGTLLQAPRLARRIASQPYVAREEPLLRFVVTSASGIAITGLVTFAIGTARLFYPPAFGAWVVLLALLFALAGDSPARPAFWTSRIAAIRAALSPGALIVYLLALVLSIPAILPETQFDALFSYHVLAVEWAHHHGIFTDYWRRYPFYAYNWPLLDAWAFVFGHQGYVDFLAWLSGCLSLLGIYGLVATLVRTCAGIVNDRVVALFGICGAAALAFSPVFVRWLDTGMVDVPIGLFFFAATAAATMAYLSRWPVWRSHFIFCAAFLLGMKTSLIFFLPVFLAVTWLIGRKTGTSRRFIIAMSAALIVLSSPWYVRNFVLDGDPVAPILNLAIHGVDGKWSRRDMAGQVSDLVKNESFSTRLRLPFDILEDTPSDSYRDYGATLVLGFVFLPALFVVFTVLRRNAGSGDGSQAFLFFSTMLVFAIAYWLQTSHAARYGLLFYATLATFVPVLLGIACSKMRIAPAVSVTLSALMALPASPTAWNYLQTIWQNDYVALASTYPSRAAYLTTHVDGYSDAQLLISILRRNPAMPQRIYDVNAEDLDFFFAENDITAIGDWFGPERYADLDKAIDTGSVVEHLARFNVSALLVHITSPAVPPIEQEKLALQLRKAGFHSVALPNSGYIMFLAPNVN